MATRMLAFSILSGLGGMLPLMSLIGVLSILGHSVFVHLDVAVHAIACGLHAQKSSASCCKSNSVTSRHTVLWNSGCFCQVGDSELEQSHK